MDWMNQLGGLLQQYQGANAQQHPQTIDNDFDQVAQAAPQNMMSQGLSEAFRSNQTPPFGNMVSQMFANSSGQQRASILNTLIAAAGPLVAQQVLGRMMGGGGGGGALGGLLGGGGGNPLGALGGLLGGGGAQPPITPEIAEQIPPQAVEQIAQQAESQDPSVIDRMSDFYSQHPTLVKGLGAAALAIALSRIAQNQQR